MNYLFFLVPVLVCPLGMVAVMVWMRRGMKHSREDQHTRSRREPHDREAA